MAQEEDIEANWSASELSILRSAELDAAPSGSVERTLTAIGVGAVLSASVGLGAASSLSSASEVAQVVRGSSWFKWLGAALVGGGIAGAVFVARHHEQSFQAAAPSDNAPAVSPTPTPPDPSAPAATVEPQSAPAAAAPPSNAMPPLTVPSSNAPTKDALAAEIRLIDEARDRLRHGDAQGSLETLARYDQLVKHGGSMRAEATVVRIEAYQASGDTARAAALAQRFVAKNPNSPYADYVKRRLAPSN
jgi:hypothetical protein